MKKLSNEELGELQKALRQLWSYASRMREQRMRKGSLDLDMPEITIRIDRKGAAEHIEKSMNDESHQLIEEFMLKANEVVAQNLREAQLPCLYRVHDKPDPEKLQELHDYLQTFNIEAGDLTNRKALVALLHQVKKHPQGHLLKSLYCGGSSRLGTVQTPQDTMASISATTRTSPPQYGATPTSPYIAYSIAFSRSGTWTLHLQQSLLSTPMRNCLPLESICALPSATASTLNEKRSK